MKLKELVLNYRQENNISQREFARRCGLSNSLISIIEVGHNPQTGREMTPDFNTYRKLANGMGISVQDLFDELGNDGLVYISNTGFTKGIIESDEFDHFMTATVPDNLPPEDIKILETLHKNPQMMETVQDVIRLLPAEVEKLRMMMKIMFPNESKKE